MKGLLPVSATVLLFLALCLLAILLSERHAVFLLPSSQSGLRVKQKSSSDNGHEKTNDKGSLAQQMMTTKTDLPHCDELMSRPFSSFRDGDFITRASTTHDWVVQPDGSRQFELRSICRLKRYTAEEARQCLTGKHVAMIGDSLTRYQFLSLVHFIHKGVWPQPFGMQSPCTHFDAKNHSMCATAPNICIEKDFREVDERNGGWSLYHEVIGGSDDGGIFDGHLECQCRRGRGAMDVSMVYDGPPPSTSTFQDIKISHFMENGWLQPAPISGWNFTGCSATGSCRYTRDHGEALLKKQAYDWSQNITSILDPVDGILPKFFPKTDFVLYNRGIWGGLPKDRAQIILPLIKNWTRPSNGRCFYKATTSGIREPPLTKFDHDAANIAYQEGCSYLDFGHVTKGFGMFLEHDPERRDIYWDQLHFIPWVYTELNNILLNVLCNAPAT